MFLQKKRLIFLIFFSVASIFFYGSAYAETTIFDVDSFYDGQKRDKVNASLHYEGQNGLFYVSDQDWSTLNIRDRSNFLVDVAALSKEFDEVIYPRTRALFGSENKPGVDGNPKIFIVFSQLTDDVGGYFRGQDGFLRSIAPDSNEREMVFLNLKHSSNVRMRSFLAHEFQHLITSNQKTIRLGTSEEVWLNELRSEIAPTLLGYDNFNIYKGSNLDSRVRTFLRDPEDAILNWQNDPKDYGAINLFGQYILDNYGRSVIASMIQNNKVGVESFNEALSSFGFEEDFSDIFTNWTLASLLNDCSAHVRELYCYKNPSLNYDTLHIDFSVGSVSGDTIYQEYSVLDWEAKWFEIVKSLQIERPQKHILHIDFSSPTTSSFEVPYVVYKKDGVSVKEIKKISINQGKGELFIEDFGFEVPRVVIIPSNQHSIVSSVGENVPDTTYNFTATLIDKLPAAVLSAVTMSESQDTGVAEELAQLPDFSDGTLIRASGDSKVYIINGEYKRWIQSAEIFDFYGHLNFNAVQVVSKDTLSLYKDSWLVRAAGDEKVYELNGDGTRHWLDMTPEKFTATGRLWNMVYVINDAELSWYREGASVK